MLTIILAVLGVALFAGLMSIGLIFKGKPLEGTCASKNAYLMEDGITCGVCGKAVGACESNIDDENMKKAEPAS